ncbi:nitronate monooxygenase [Vagococcus fluvialis]|uniref:nitronate monooxygenase n=1 Tax=Vagococcus fluvialis TaxID=2738 RepID=UPI001A8C5C68|nr:nitronate monooxygenase [Vagococcus fluvialis]MBO0486502.1 nitronate monooxygenase [Vagococcus fluvialis]
MTRMTDLVGIKYPIFQGGMQHISRSPLVIAVSNAGGLGLLTTGALDAEGLRKEINTVRDNTDKPFGVNLNLLQPNIDELVDIVIEEKVAIVTTGAGSPKKYFPRFKEAGIIVIPVVAAVKHALKMQELGVDAIIAEGQEAGGHIGKSGTLPLVRQITDAVDLPVIAAGGFADGKGLVAALALGAEGVQMGTVFLATEECPIPDSFKESVVNAIDTTTMVTGRKGGHPVRALQNNMLVEYLTLEMANAPEEELEKLTVGSLYRAVVEGDTETGTMMAGEISGLVPRIRPVKEVIDGIMKEAKETIANLSL